MFDGSWKVRARGASNFRNCEFIKEIDWQTTQRNPSLYLHHARRTTIGLRVPEGRQYRVCRNRL